jgi:hypothetical protein
MSADSKTETLAFKLGISGIYWDKKPKYQIVLNDKVIKEGEVASGSGEIEYHEFSHTFEIRNDFKNTNTLEIRFLNKTPDQTVKADDWTEENMSIAKDMLLVFENLEIDNVDIPIGADFGPDEKYGMYHIDVPVEYKNKQNVNSLQGVRHMGWNGKYVIQFETPFYIWLLESL